MSFTVTRQNSPLGPQLTCYGELDLHTVPRLRAALASAQFDAPALVTVDLAAVTFMDSAGLNLLFDARRTARHTGAVLQLARPSANVMRLLEVVGADRVFDLQPQEPPAPA
ncbi:MULTISPECIES: STAS domain-containing protein [unclassified Kitasatospora]|uniref:STAS domain-containing protein n=1 Tax=unclassified Kitasatospora TaxID=2633591 RepID=UPI003811E230